MFENINWIAILLCGVGAMVVGFIWYSMAVFGKPWMKSIGMSAKDMKPDSSEMPKTYGLMFIGALIEAYVLSVIITTFGATDYFAGAQGAFWIWLGFIATSLLGAVLYEKKSWTYYGITAGYQLVNLLVMSVILLTL